MSGLIAFLTANVWRTASIGLLIVGLVLLTLRSCDNDDVIEREQANGARIEREQVNTKVLSDAEKVQAADAAIRGSTVTERMREDPHCRDCADD